MYDSVVRHFVRMEKSVEIVDFFFQCDSSGIIISGRFIQIYFPAESFANDV